MPGAAGTARAELCLPHGRPGRQWLRPGEAALKRKEARLYDTSRTAADSKLKLGRSWATCAAEAARHAGQGDWGWQRASRAPPWGSAARASAGPGSAGAPPTQGTSRTGCGRANARNLSRFKLAIIQYNVFLGKI